MPSKFTEKAERLAWLVRRGRLPQAVGYVSQLLFKRSLYADHLATYFATDYLPVRVKGNIMYLSPTDSGISSELLHFGTREGETTDAMRWELMRLRRNATDPVVLDIGAHRGYYTFQAAEILADGTVYAFEPDPVNFEALQRGIETNGFENVRAERCAIGDEDTTAELKTSVCSNSHTLGSVPETLDWKYSGETVETGVRRLDSYLAEEGLTPEDVDLVKIDVEGYETAVFDGVTELLEAESELVVFVELHPHRVDPADLHSLVDAVSEAGFELVDAASSADSDIPDYDAVKRHLETRDGRHTVELVARRTPTAATEETKNGFETDVPDETHRDGIVWRYKA
jgi:FkbM family methyltransferase